MECQAAQYLEGSESAVAHEEGEHTMKVDCGVCGKTIGHKKLDIIPLPQLQCWPGKLAVHEDHLARDTCRCPVLPRQGNIEAHRVTGGTHVEVAAIGP